MAKTIKGNGTINGTDEAEIIKGGNGDDTITGGKGNDTITGGAGRNTIIYNVGDGNDVINFSKDEKLTLRMDSYHSIELSPDKKDIRIYTTADKDEYITIKNYDKYASNDGSTDLGRIELKVGGTEDYEWIGLEDIYFKEVVNNNFKGTAYDDEIDASGATKGLKLDGGAGNDFITGSDYSDTIIGGVGDDYIQGGKGNDVITGGAGRNVINYCLGDGDDVIYLTKGEELIINFSKFGTNDDGTPIYDWEEMPNMEYAASPNGRDLIIYVDKNDHTAGSLTLKDFLLKDVTDGVSINIKNSDSGEDLPFKTISLTPENVKISTSTSSNFTGTRFNDEINASGAVLFKDKNQTVPKVSTDKGLKLDGGAGNDSIIGSRYSDTITGGVGNDILEGGDGNDVINGGDGDDVITGGKGNDVITGGTGHNTIIYNVGDGNDVINLTKGENFTLKMDSYYSIELSANKKDVLIYTTSAKDEYITIKNLGSKDVTNNSTKKTADTSSIDLVVGDGDPIDLRGYLYTKKTDKDFTGSWLNDKIDASEAYLTKKVKKETVEKLSSDKGLKLNGGVGNDEIIGSKYSDTITGGAGNDLIKGGKGNDVITGGAGQNTIIYNAGDGNDVINLTKGENFTLKMDGYYSIEVAKNGKDVLIYTTSAKDEYITIKNLASKDVTNNSTKKTSDTSSVTLITDSETINLRNFVYETKTDKNFKGSWLNDEINASEAYLTKKVKKEIVEKASSDKGLKLDGGAGNDTIIGSKYSDTIIGGKGNDSIEGGKGNDVITGGAGDNTIRYHYGDGNDVINITKGENLTLILNGMTNRLHYTVEYAKNKKDVIIRFNNKEYITIKNAANAGSIILKSNGSEAGMPLYVAAKPESDYTGAALNDEIDARNTILYKDKNKTVEKEATDKGLKLNGGAGNDTIYGSKYSDTIYGGIGNDDIRGGDGNDKIYGGDGDDYIDGDAGNDTIYGGAGNDTIVGGAGNDLLYGDAGDDSILGNEGDDTIYGGSGNDTIYGGSGNDLLYGDAGDDLIEGGLGNDTIYGGIGDDKIDGEEGNDYLDGGAGDDSIEGGEGNDTILGGEGNDTIRGGKGNDLIYGGAGNDEIYGDEGDDTIYAGDGDDTIYAIKDKNLIFAGKGNDRINVFRGAENTYVFDNGDGNCTIYMNYSTVPDYEVKHDTINLTGVDKSGFKLEVRNGDIGRDGQYRQDVYIRYNLVRGTYKDCIIIKNFIGYSVDLKDIEIITKDGQHTSLNEMLKNNMSDGNLTKGRTVTSNESNDTLLGSFLGDTIIANGANSLVYGGDGNDSITSTGGNSTLHGGAGNDFITGGSGDIIYGDDGDDLIYGGDNGNEIYGGEGDDAIYGGSGNDTIDGGDDDDHIEGGDGNDSINGGNGNDYIKGGAGNDIINGGEGNDTLFGDDGDDTINGGAGDDNIVGGAGNDVLWGEEGNDVLDGGEGNDTIYAGEGDDTIYATLGENTIVAGKGDDVVNTSLIAKNTYICNNYDGKTTINFDGNYSASADIPQDVIQLNDVDQLGYTVEVADNRKDVYIYYNNRADYIIITDYMNNYLDKKDIIIKTNDGLTKSLFEDWVKTRLTGGRELTSNLDYATIYGSELRDTITANGVNSTIYGKGGNDSIIGSNGNDTIDGGDGNDNINGGAGDDSILGGKGNDILYGGAGNDTIYGGEGDDQIYGNDGDDLLYGEAGDDSIVAGRGNDTIYGGDGDDNITAGTSGTKLIVGGKGDDIIKLNTSATNILEFNNGDGNDTVQETVDGTGNVVTIKLNDTDKDAFSQKVSGNDLIISYNKNASGMYEDTITYKDFFKNLEYIPEIKIKTNDGYESTAKISELKEAIAGWLSSTGYSDIATGMASATEDQINELNNIFAVNQEQILPS